MIEKSKTKFKDLKPFETIILIWALQKSQFWSFRLGVPTFLGTSTGWIPI